MPSMTTNRLKKPRRHSTTHTHSTTSDAQQAARATLTRAEGDNFAAQKRVESARRGYEDAQARFAGAEEGVKEAHRAVEEAMRFLEEMRAVRAEAKREQDTAMGALRTAIKEQDGAQGRHAVALMQYNDAARRTERDVRYDTDRIGGEDGWKGSVNSGWSNTVSVTSSEGNRMQMQEEMTRWEWGDYARRIGYQYNATDSTSSSGTMTSYEPVQWYSQDSERMPRCHRRSSTRYPGDVVVQY